MKVTSAACARQTLDGGTSVTFINPFSYYVLRRSGFLSLINRDFEVKIDGVSLVWLNRMLRLDPKGRQSFDDTSLAPIVFKECAQRGLRVALVGGVPGVAERAAEFLRVRYTGLQIECIRDGYFSNDNSRKDALSEAGSCDVVVVAMGTPHQEIFLSDLRAGGWCGDGFTCGGYLDQLVSAGGGSYYPEFANRFNLRWMYRIYQEPKRLIYRYFFIYPLGSALYLYDMLRKDRSG